MFTICKRFEFSAAHHLEGLPDGHPCGRVHGHNYIVEVEFSAEKLDRRGFVRDFGDLDGFGSYIAGVFDHQDLNKILPQPTSEYLAHHLCDVLEARFGMAPVAVRVSETPKTWAEWRP